MSEYCAADKEIVDPCMTLRYVLGDRFHVANNPHKSPLCWYHDINLLQQSNTIKTSYQESENNRENVWRLRSSCMQNFSSHFYNYYGHLPKWGNCKKKPKGYYFKGFLTLFRQALWKLGRFWNTIFKYFVNFISSVRYMLCRWKYHHSIQREIIS